MRPTLAEESSILDNANVLDQGIHHYGTTIPQDVLNFFIGPQFRWWLYYDESSLAEVVEFTVDLGASYGFKSAFYMAWNWPDDGWDLYNYRSGLFLGDDSTPLSSTNQVTDDIFSTGFFNSISSAEGRYVSVRRTEGD